MIAPSDLEKLEEYRSLLEDIIELQKQVGHITQNDLDALAEYVVRRADRLPYRQMAHTPRNPDGNPLLGRGIWSVRPIRAGRGSKFARAMRWRS